MLKAAAAVDYPASPPATPTGESAAKLQAAIDAASDPAARGLGYTALAELQVANGLPREAMWAYLWVDVVYNQNHDDHVLAVARLVQLFEAMGDKERADQFREKLTRVRGGNRHAPRAGYESESHQIDAARLRLNCRATNRNATVTTSIAPVSIPK